MIIQIHITDEQLASYLARLRYETKMKEVSEFETAYHNRLVERKMDRLHVKVDGRWFPAKPFFEGLLDKGLMQMLDGLTTNKVKKLKNEC